MHRLDLGLIAATILGLLVNSAAALDERVEKAISALAPNRDCYQNIQAEWSESREIGGARSTLRHRFWSREGAYYRLDSEFLEGGDVSGSPRQQRTIVRPEGFARLAALDSNDLAIVDTGTQIAGTDRLYADPLFNASVRGLTAYAEDVFKACGGSKPVYQIVSVAEEGDALKVTLEAPPTTAGKYVYEYRVDVKRGVCLDWREELRSGDKVVSWHTSSKKYAEDLVPTEIKIEWKTDKGETGSRHLKRESFKEGPAPLDVFSLAAQGTSVSSVWTRRLLIFTCGIFLLGIYLVYRWRKERN